VFRVTLDAPLAETRVIRRSHLGPAIDGIGRGGGRKVVRAPISGNLGIRELADGTEAGWG